MLGVVGVENLSETIFHLVDHFFQPGFNLSFDLNWFDLNFFTFFRDESVDIINSVVFGTTGLVVKSMNTLKDLSNMLKDWFWVF